MKRIHEGLRYEDMRGLISKTFDIDRYKPKIGDESNTVVVAFTVTYDEPAKDLSNFIETGDFEHLDVESSDAPEKDGSYRVFVEFTRDHNLYEKIELLLRDVSQITDYGDGGWKYKAYRAKGKTSAFNKNNFRRDIITSASRYRREVLKNKEREKTVDRLKALVKS